MLVALTENGTRIFAEAAKKGEQFFCPCCGAPMLLKKGRVKIDHFAHIASHESCGYSNESMLHQATKASIYKSLRGKNLDFVDVEYPLDGCRPDVFFSHNGTKIAIEVQKTQISPDEIVKRTRILNSLGVFALWVTPGVPIEREVRLKEMWRFLKGWNFGSLFTWNFETQTVSALGWESATRFSEWTGQLHYCKTKGSFYLKQSNLDIFNDFRPTSRGYNSRFPQFPRAMLYLPNKGDVR